MRAACLNAVYALAQKDKRISFIGSDIGYGLIDDYRRQLPDQFFIEGISEQNLVGVAAGMAHEGKIVYLAMIAAFLSRAYEQIKLDVALHNLPVRFVGFGGGLMYSHEGPTHLALDDMALMLGLGLGVCAPVDKNEMRALMPRLVDYPGPVYVRLGWGEPIAKFGQLAEFIPDADVTIISTGNITTTCIEAKDMLKAEGIRAQVWHQAVFNQWTDFSWVRDSKMVVTVEEGIDHGGLGTLVSRSTPIKRCFSLPLFPAGYGDRPDMLARYGLTAEHIVQTIKTLRG